MPYLRALLMREELLKVKIQLPNGQQHKLDESLSLTEKIVVVKELTEEWMPVILRNWQNDSVKYFLDSLSNYLNWHKEPSEVGKEDKIVLSRKKIEKLVRYKKTSKTTNFTDLSSTNKELLLGESRGNHDE